ncbi:uncharacterized protein LOC113781404 [Coffea eugenioides]|uniref:uncharacterized protein LOC113781404 n=1 Tax=Coffea eugenioides TaxID=49369 RepID=UPI000F60F36C|nr:uncharacterized protein LOC113781404 [Coffea eugenioides]
MFSSLRSLVNGKVPFDSRKTNKVVIYRDELDTKKPSQSKPKKKVSFETKPLVQNQVAGEKNFDMKNTTFAADNENKAGLKLKILMTKEEAARLLSKCKEGGVLEYKDVASELVQIPVNRVSLVSSAANKSSPCLLKKSTVDKEE